MNSLWYHTTPHSDGYREARPTQLHLCSDERIVDVREALEFVGELGHIPQAELAPLSDLMGTAQAWDRATALIVVCRSGKRSAAAAKQLVSLGFEKVINLQGGMRDYNEAGLPISKLTAGEGE